MRADGFVNVGDVPQISADRIEFARQRHPHLDMMPKAGHRRPARKAVAAVVFNAGGLAAGGDRKTNFTRESIHRTTQYSPIRNCDMMNVMKRPLIGITTDHNSRELPDGTVEHTQYLLPHAYSVAVEKAGGVPILLPYRSDLSLVPTFVDLCDGFVFSGGNDYDPASFGEHRHPMAVATDPAREAFERGLIAEVERRRLPVLGICGGMQLMNLHRKGSLHQFIPDQTRQIEHRRFTIDEWGRRHAVEIDRQSVLHSLIGKGDVESNTSHKQAVNRVGDRLSIVARAPDGVVEAIEDPSMPMFVGVQWHPERQHDEPDHLALFRHLVDRAQARPG
jgi:putative glutamine amidotransferase